MRSAASPLPTCLPVTCLAGIFEIWLRPGSIVMGKYLAGLAFYSLALAGTLTIPVTLVWLGSPDLGAIACGYLGSVLLGGLFLSVGIFISGFFKDQIAAFVLTFLACAFFVVVGTQFSVAVLDGWVPNLGTFLSQAFSVAAHFDGIQRGVIGLDDVTFFVTLSAVFLALNAYSLEGRKY